MTARRLRGRLAVPAMVAALVALAAPARAEDLVGDPLPAASGAWDALAANFDGRQGRDIVISAHDARDGHWGGIYLADGAGGWRLGFPFPRGDRHGCDSGDVDGDGRLDLYCAVGADRGTGSGLNNLFIQQPDGSFVDEAAAWGVQDPLGRGRRPLLFDSDGDGRLDLYLTNGKRADGASPGNRLYLNTGNRSFAEQVGAATGNLGFRCVAHGDVTGDGREDLIVCGQTLHVLKGTRSGYRPVGYLGGSRPAQPRDAQLADLDRDGRSDLVLVLRDRVQIRLNRRGGRRFAKVARTVRLRDGQRAIVGDLTGNSGRDVYVTDGCTADGRNARDRLLSGGRLRAFTSAGDPSGGCGNEVLAADGRLIVLNGDGAAVGPVSSRKLPLARRRR